VKRSGVFTVVKLVIGVYVALCIALLAARLLGSTMSRPALMAVIDPGKCAQPCWHEIRPGTTTIYQAYGLLHADSQLISDLQDLHSSDSTGQGGVRDIPELCWKIAVDWEGCAFRDLGSSGPINQLDLDPMQSQTQTFTLADALMEFGTPAASQLCIRLGIVYSIVYFPNNVEVRARSNRLNPLPQYTLDMGVFVVRYHYPANEPPYQFDTPQWHGFSRLPPDFC
jgi:hypothetical protein